MTLAVHRNGVIGRIADEIRLVISDHDAALLPEPCKKVVGQAAVAIVEKGYVPRPRYAFEYRRKTMQRNQSGQPARLAAALDLGLDALVIGPENPSRARHLR